MLEVQVIAKKLRSQNVVSVDLVAINGVELPAFEAGAHIDLHLQNGLVRQYSLFHSPNQRDQYRIAIQLAEESRGGSHWVHRNLQVGDIISVSEPKNVFQLAENAPKHVLFAGGIGITPLLSMAECLSDSNQEFELHYSAKSKVEAPFCKEISVSSWADQAQFYFSDEANRLDANKIFADLDPEAHIYVCGPERYIEYVLQTAKESSWPEEQVHRELFQAPANHDERENTAFELHLSLSGLTLDVPADSSVLDVLTEAGVDVPFSCGEGVCGTCITNVIDGTPEHRDHYLTDKEKACNREFLPCCSRSKTPSLTIEL
ncbi:PDR/VanB family oxidoreductase [Vibrio alginolyticus]|nr:PDR/VanB family oxidoreductase [Vibrio alginolyticus]